MTAGGKTCQEIESTAISVRQRQEGHVTGTFVSQLLVDGVTHVTRQTIQRHDNALAETGCSARVVDGTNLRVRALVEMHILRPVSIRVLLFELIRNRLKIDLLRVQRQRNRMPVVQANRRQHIRNLVKVHAFPVDITNEKQFALRMVDNVNGIVRTEILQNRHNNSSVGHRRQIDGNPVAVILAHYGNLVVLFDSALLEKDMQLLDVNSQLAVSQGDVGSVIRYSLVTPVLAEAPLEHLDKIIFLFRHHKPTLFLFLPQPASRSSTPARRRCGPRYTGCCRAKAKCRGSVSSVV